MLLHIEVVLSYATQLYAKRLEVPAGIQAREVVKLAVEQGLTRQSTLDLDLMIAPLGIFGERVADSHILESGDRVEIYRPLKQDPKELRRRRAQKAKRA